MRNRLKENPKPSTANIGSEVPLPRILSPSSPLFPRIIRLLEEGWQDTWHKKNEIKTRTPTTVTDKMNFSRLNCYAKNNEGESIGIKLETDFYLILNNISVCFIPKTRPVIKSWTPLQFLRETEKTETLSKSTKFSHVFRSHRYLNSDRWIQSPVPAQFWVLNSLTHWNVRQAKADRHRHAISIEISYPLQ